MAKHDNINFFQASHVGIERTVNKKLSLSARWLYIILLKLENRIGSKGGNFYRSHDMLAKDANLSRISVLRAVKELEKEGLIKTFPQFFESEKSRTGRDRKHTTGFIIIRVSNQYIDNAKYTVRVSF